MVVHTNYTVECDNVVPLVWYAIYNMSMASNKNFGNIMLLC